MRPLPFFHFIIYPSVTDTEAAQVWQETEELSQILALHGFEKVRHLGGGGMGIVFYAEKGGVPRVIKKMLSSIRCSVSDLVC